MTTDSLFDVSQEIVLITGSSGQLGGEYAKIFLERGANVIGLDVRPSADSDSLSARYPERYLFCASDVTVKASLQRALIKITSKFGTPTLFLFNQLRELQATRWLSSTPWLEGHELASLFGMG
jgi:NAD(P)-dependent dehydrogenase (short-subunit alcohol dehydrogenase family)